MCSVVSEARRIILSDSHETLTVGQPLPVNPEAQRAVMEGIAAKAAKFRAQRPAISEGTGLSTEGIDESILLNWGPEGDEGPLTATGT